MNIKKIIVSIPTHERKWTVSFFGHGILRRNSASVVFNAIERRLRAYSEGDKLAISVKVGKDTVNETLGSNDKDYLLFTSAAFLEDYLGEEMLLRIERSYCGKA